MTDEEAQEIAGKLRYVPPYGTSMTGSQQSGRPGWSSWTHTDAGTTISRLLTKKARS